jgi:hypothetical protein
MRLECAGDWDGVIATFAHPRHELYGDPVLAASWLTGTHLRPLWTPKGETAPTGKTFRVRIMASFEFAPGTANIICERPYCDRRAVVTALGIG